MTLEQWGTLKEYIRAEIFQQLAEHQEDLHGRQMAGADNLQEEVNRKDLRMIKLILQRNFDE